MRFRASFFSICQKFKVVTSAIVGCWLPCIACADPSVQSDTARLGYN